MTYKQDFYKTTQKERDDFFLEYLVPVMEYLEHLAFIEEWIQNLDTAAYEKNINRDVRISSIKKQIDRNEKTENWQTIIKESLN